MSDNYGHCGHSAHARLSCLGRQSFYLSPGAPKVSILKHRLSTARPVSLDCAIPAPWMSMML